MKEGVFLEILVVSDLHGKVPEGLEVLSQSFNGPVIFLGDIVGTDLLGKLQKIFYDGFFNPLKKLLANTNPGETSILSYPAENNQTIGEAYCCLTDFLRQIGPFEVESPSDYVWSLRHYVHFGHFVSNLPEGIRQGLQKDMEDNALKIINLMSNFTNRGQEVFMVEGNWDARTPLDFYSTEECLPLPVGERSFYFKDFLKKQNPKVHYFSDIGQIKYHQHHFVFWPFDSAVINTTVPDSFKVKPDQDDGKLILFSHGQADWFAVKGNSPMTGEGSRIQETMATVIKDLKPNVIVHGHLHQESPDYFYQDIPVYYFPLLAIRILTI